MHVQVEPLLPRKITEKTRMLDPLASAADRAALDRWFSSAAIPDYAGGRAECPGGIYMPLDTTERTREAALYGNRAAQVCTRVGMLCAHDVKRCVCSRASAHVHWYHVIWYHVGWSRCME